MIAAIVERRFKAAERQLGASVDYLRDMFRASRGAVVKIALFLPLAAHRKAAPADLCHAARLVAVLAEDCGPCAQIVVNQARKDGMDRGAIRALLAGRPDRLPESLRQAHDFAQAVLARDAGAAALRQALAERYGDAAVVDLALAIATARVFPTVKWAMGHGVSCALVEVDV